ncbi:hypothetical protein [Poritiphilus flavus]|uniref:Sigma-70 family RNA polymerase sigma factor n=1 Tax=Poritiphilus flavus TaxID=2697053 RepID=A0A6L9EHL9_9FLAO|nr:hypothetical protein [Poritiphilus flavus]NAS13729.1 hypothetical protein [Poritiphilus flavus]
MTTKALQKHKKEDDFTQFYKKLEELVPGLKKFVAGSLQTAEDQALLDKRFYDPDEILDEVYLETFREFSGQMNENELRRGLFKKALQRIAAKQEEEVPDEVNTHALLKGELKTLSEEFTTDAEGDRILMDELDDISYIQKQGWSPEIVLNDSLEKQLVQNFELDEASLLSDEKRKLLGLLYNTIPKRSKLIVELIVFGQQNTSEISWILEVPEEIVKRIVFKVGERFRLL